MDIMDYIGLDVYRKTISYCVKDAIGNRSTKKAGSAQRDTKWMAG